jgi:hypothetical protein
LLLAIDPGANGLSTYYITGPAPLTNNPSSTNGSAQPFYQDGIYINPGATPLSVTIVPDLVIKAVNVGAGGSSAISTAEFIFQVANPSINGDNGALFTVSDITSNTVFWYTTDGTTPTNAPPSIGPLSGISNAPVTLSFSVTTNVQFQVRGFRNGYQPSGTAAKTFTPAAFHPNAITFGTASGEGHSSFITRPGQFYYAPVTLQLLPGGDTMYSLQFNVAVTNGLSTPNKIVNGAGIDFFPMLMSQVPPAEGSYFPPANGQWYLPILPFVTGSGGSNSIVSSIFVNTNSSLLGVGWLYRTGFKYTLTDTNGTIITDFDPQKQDLITYSIIHDTLFNKSGEVVVVGAYSFQVPTNANLGDKYYIQIGSPSATRDGVGAPGADVFIQPPVDSTAVTVGAPSYLVGDAAPFRWLNAGDFGEGMLDNADVMQVFQSAILGVDMPPANSDLFLAMDSCGNIGVFDATAGYYTNAFAYTNVFGITNLFDGNDLTINTNVFGDGNLDACDVYVTYRRSLDPSLTWFKRFWTNNQFVAVITPNLATNNLLAKAVQEQSATVLSKASVETSTTYQQLSVQFTAGDAIGSAGQTIQIPITASVFGNYPLRILGLNLTVHPLDGSPAITQAVQFTPAAGLGQPTIVAPKNAANYSAVWLDSKISGLTGDATVGTLTVNIPTNATSSSAYAVHFDRASASPNGIVPFPEQKFTGLVTLSSRTNSTYNDGIPDSWRLRWFGTINNYLSLSNACATGDGVNNFKKYVAGVDPTVANDFPSVNAKRPVPAGYTAAIHWPTVNGKQYAIERSTSLFPGNWTPVTTNTGTGTDLEFDDLTGGPTHFYRVRILP